MDIKLSDEVLNEHMERINEEGYILIYVMCPACQKTGCDTCGQTGVVPFTPIPVKALTNALNVAIDAIIRGVRGDTK